MFVELKHGHSLITRVIDDFLIIHGSGNAHLLDENRVPLYIKWL